MKRTKIKSGLLAGLLGLLFLTPAFKDEKLTDVVKPYLGVYECKEAVLGGEDLLARFSKLEIELKKNGACSVYYKEKGGKRKSLDGRYSYDEERETIRFQSDDFEFFKRDFPLKKGTLYITFPVGEKILRLEFEQK